MSFLEENPFYILGVTPSDTRETIVTVAEDKSFFDDDKDYNTPRDILLSPIKRVFAEYTYITKVKNQEKFLKTIEDRVIFENDLSKGLTAININLYNFQISKDYNQKAKYLYEVIRFDNDSDINDIADEIDKNRQKAGFNDLSKKDMQDGIICLRNKIIEAVKEVILNKDSACPAFINNVLSSTVFHHKCGVVAFDLLNTYKEVFKAEIRDAYNKANLVVQGFSPQNDPQSVINALQDFKTYCSPLFYSFNVIGKKYNEGINLINLIITRVERTLEEYRKNNNEEYLNKSELFLKYIKDNYKYSLDSDKTLKTDFDNLSNKVAEFINDRKPIQKCFRLIKVFDLNKNVDLAFFEEFDKAYISLNSKEKSDIFFAFKNRLKEYWTKNDTDTVYGRMERLFSFLEKQGKHYVSGFLVRYFYFDYYKAWLSEQLSAFEKYTRFFFRHNPDEIMSHIQKINNFYKSVSGFKYDPKMTISKYLGLLNEYYYSGEDNPTYNDLFYTNPFLPEVQSLAYKYKDLSLASNIVPKFLNFIKETFKDYPQFLAEFTVDIEGEFNSEVSHIIGQIDSLKNLSLVGNEQALLKLIDDISNINASEIKKSINSRLNDKIIETVNAKDLYPYIKALKSRVDNLVKSKINKLHQGERNIFIFNILTIVKERESCPEMVAKTVSKFYKDYKAGIVFIEEQIEGKFYELFNIEDFDKKEKLTDGLRVLIKDYFTSIRPFVLASSIGIVKEEVLNIPFINSIIDYIDKLIEENKEFAYKLIKSFLGFRDNLYNIISKEREAKYMGVIEEFEVTCASGETFDLFKNIKTCMRKISVLPFATDLAKASYLVCELDKNFIDLGDVILSKVVSPLEKEAYNKLIEEGETLINNSLHSLPLKLRKDILIKILALKEGKTGRIVNKCISIYEESAVKLLTPFENNINAFCRYIGNDSFLESIERELLLWKEYAEPMLEITGREENNQRKFLNGVVSFAIDKSMDKHYSKKANDLLKFIKATFNPKYFDKSVDTAKIEKENRITNSRGVIFGLVGVIIILVIIIIALLCR